VFIQGEQESLLAGPVDADILDPEEWEVEAIWGHRRTSLQEFQYGIKWAGYRAPSWEPQNNLLPDCIEMLRAYNEEHGLRIYDWMSKVCAIL
jgi:hypothetical protein